MDDMEGLIVRLLSPLDALSLDIDVRPAADGVVLFAEIPDIDENSLKVGLAPRSVDIQGARSGASGAARFHQRVTLSSPIDPKRASVAVSEGLLRVRLPFIGAKP